MDLTQKTPPTPQTFPKPLLSLGCQKPRALSRRCVPSISGPSLYYERADAFGRTAFIMANPAPLLQSVQEGPQTGTSIYPPAAKSPITDQDRYSRQILFPGIGHTGQQLLASAHVAIVGVGATGAPTASLLARAGVGTLPLIA